MKVSKNWLKDYLNLDNIKDEELFKEISFHMCEIESYEKLCSATGLVIGEVLECEMHPDSDHLHVCKVNTGKDVLQIVCGAPNCTKGIKVIVALVGAVLPGDFKIKDSKIRGVESHGMLCSLQELGIEEKYVADRFKNGIYIFEGDEEVGSDPLKALGFDDTVIDLDLTSNRSDLLSIEGVAFDLGATLNQKVFANTGDLEEIEKENPVKVTIDTDKCYKYCARYIEGVNIKESPLWMQARLIASGIRPINNVVDITNYVLIEMGQPLHAFDADKLGNNILVRQAYKGEKMKTLDNIERDLEETDIVITDGKTPQCLGGVMGGLESEVESYTKNIVLESAYFDPLSIRKTSSRLGLKSESSTRFERKIDYDRVERALDYAASLMADLCDAKVYKGITKEVKVEMPLQTVNVTVEKINSVLGTDLSKEFIEDIFNRLAYDYKKMKDGSYTIILPSRRMDLEPSYQDICEDVARMYGYNNIPTTLAETSDKGGLTYVQQRTRILRNALANRGLNEVISYSLIAEKDLGLYVSEIKNPIKPLMPMTEDRAVMRQSLLNGVIDAVKYNKARKMDNVNIFEIGKTYSTEGESLHLAIAMTGIFEREDWNGFKQVADFYLLKGILDSTLEKLNIKVFYQADSSLANFHPGRCAEIIFNNRRIGTIGQLHPKFAKENDLGQTVALEIELADILSNVGAFAYKPINKFPAIQRDLAIVCKKDIKALDIETLIKQTGKKLLTNVELFDLYTGENVGEDEKSLAFKLTFEDPNKTLETEDVDKIIKSIVFRLDSVYKARLR